MVAAHDSDLRQDAETLPAELAAALRAHPYCVGLSVVLAWLVALVVTLMTPTQFEADVTMRVGQVGVVEAVQRNNSLQWVTDSYPLEDLGSLAGRLFGERGAAGKGDGSESMPPAVYGIRSVEEGRRSLRIIARAASAQAAQTFLESVAERIIEEHATLLADARAMQDAAQEAMRSRIAELQGRLNTAASDAATAEQLSQEMALLTFLDLQLQHARGPVLTRPTGTSGVETVGDGPVEPRTSRNFAVASVAGLFLGFAIAVFLRGLKGSGQ
jgi:uncharacterized protein involved in exopolysaccharide biosynthesis